MKNVSFLFIFTIILFVFNMNVSSQTWTPGTNKMFINPWNTNVGVGTSNPQTRLHVYGSGGQNSFRVDVSGRQKFLVASNGGTSIGGSVTPPANGLYVAGNIKLGNTTNNTNYTLAVRGTGNFNIATNKNFFISGWEMAGAGGVTIGTNNDINSVHLPLGFAASSFLFSGGPTRFNGLVIAKEIRVQTNIWADYVFNSDYELKPLTEVEQFIKENKHLPNVPKQEIVIEEGINLGDMNVILMQKIEELTLYIIELNKKVEVLEQTSNK